jgi:hypothetical protein
VTPNFMRLCFEGETCVFSRYDGEFVKTGFTAPAALRRAGAIDGEGKPIWATRGSC